MEKLVLIDGNSLINRAFYAMPLLMTKSGEPTNAVLGFLNMFFKMLAEENPTHCVVAFDLKAPTFRHKMYSEYKGTRKPMPEELRPQIPLLKEVLRLMGVTCVEKEGFEADDIIGTIAKNTRVKTLIYTGDKDSFQLVDDETSIYFTRRGITDIEVYSVENFTEKTGIKPCQVIELKALMGDTSDNIPGVSGVGEKTALTLVQTYGKLEDLYSNIADLKGKLKEKLEAGKDSAYLSRTLATIDVNCGVNCELSSMVLKTPFSDQVKKKFFELEFRSLTKKEELFSDSEIVETLDDNVIPKNDVKVINSSDSQIFSQVKGNVFALFVSNKQISVYDQETQTEYQLKIGETLLDDGANLSDGLKAVCSLFDGRTCITHCKKDLKHLLKDCIGYQLDFLCEDVSLMKYITDYNGNESLTDVIETYGLTDLPTAYAIYSIYLDLKQKLIEENTESLYRDMELPLSDLLFEMEDAGFKVDYENLNEAGKKYKEILSELENKIKELTEAPELNVNSPKQLGELLFVKLKVGKGKKNSNGYSTSADVLESLEDAHPSIPLILKYRQIQKLYSTYVEGFKPLIDRKTGLIHTSFNQTVTATGRLSSKEPNLQNIPVRDDEGKELRKLFVPRSKDRVLISADYSQIELRLLAAFSNCEGLIKAFCDGEDVHSITASKVFKVPLDKVTSQMRRSAKAVNFGIIYGISEFGLAKNLKISNSQAREYINSYFAEYPEVKAYMDGNVAFAKEHGYAKTFLGRKRYIRELKSENRNLRQFGERAAMNMPLQGASADIIKIAMINVSNRLKREGLKSELILQIHDELIIDAFREESERAKIILKEEMEGAVKLKVKLTVETGEGETWFDCK